MRGEFFRQPGNAVGWVVEHAGGDAGFFDHAVFVQQRRRPAQVDVHRLDRPAAKDVQMEMRHLLHAVRPGIGDGAEALPLVQRKVQITGQAGDGAVEIDDLGIRGIGGEIVAFVW